jgi:hypothetical protein
MKLTQQDLDRYLADPAALVLERLVLPTGQPYSKSIQDFQREFFRAIFAHKQGRPEHRLVYDERRRGESKTEDCAAAALGDLLTGPIRSRSFAVAVDADQAALILDSIAGFKSRSPILQDITVLRSVVTNPATNSSLRVLSADAPTAYGIRPRKVFFDELSLQPDDRLWTAMWSSIGKSAEAQMVAVSMAGSNFSGLGWKIREQARQSPAYYFHTRQGSELAPWLSARDLDEQQATLHPSDFARFWLCEWREPRGSWITREMYEQAEVGRAGIKGDGAPRYGFVDVGLVHDPTAIAIVHKEGDRVVLDALETLQGSRNEPVELEALEELVSEMSKDYGCFEWIFESPQAVASVQRLQSRLRGVRVEARYPTAENQARLWGNLYQLFANHRLVVFPHEQLKKEALSLHTRAQGGRIKVVESSGIVHQDHILAVGGAALLAEDCESSTIAIYDAATDSGYDRTGFWQGDPDTGERIYGKDPYHEPDDEEEGWGLGWERIA